MSATTFAVIGTRADRGRRQRGARARVRRAHTRRLAPPLGRHRAACQHDRDVLGVVAGLRVS